MGSDLPRVAELSLPQPAVEALTRMLGEDGIEFERAGGQRGVAGAVELVIVLLPSLTVAALVIDKLRRLRLPRTYIRVGETLEVWTDTTTPDGRVLIVKADGSVDELPDGEISAASLVARLRELGRGD